MIRLLKFLFTGDWHLHKWKIIEERKIELWEDDRSNVIKTCKRYVQQCESCGKIQFIVPPDIL